MLPKKGGNERPDPCPKSINEKKRAPSGPLRKKKKRGSQHGARKIPIDVIPKKSHWFGKKERGGKGGKGLTVSNRQPSGRGECSLQKKKKKKNVIDYERRERGRARKNICSKIRENAHYHAKKA